MHSQLVIIIVYIISLNIDSLQVKMNPKIKDKRKFLLSQFLENYVKSCWDSLLFSRSKSWRCTQLELLGLRQFFCFFAN